MSDPTPPASFDATVQGYVLTVVKSVVSSAVIAGGAWLATHGIHIPDPSNEVITVISGGVLVVAGGAYKAVKSYLDHRMKEALAEAAPGVEVKK